MDSSLSPGEHHVVNSPPLEIAVTPPKTSIVAEQALLDGSDPAPDGKDGEDGEKPANSKKQEQDGLLRSWWKEIAAVSLSTGALVAEFVTLYPHDHQPLPEWPYSISVNTLISIYAAIFKAAILFAMTEIISQLKWLWYRREQPLKYFEIYDQASRGVWGSLSLLWHVGPRDILANIGSIIVMLMVVVDPFTQQLLDYYDDEWPVPSYNTSLIRTNALTDLGSYSVHVLGGASIPPTWQNAINGGIFLGAQSIPVTCATGNCTFPDTYATLGFCSTCSDISNQLKITNETYTWGDGDNIIHNWGINSSLPSGFHIFNPFGGQVNWTGTYAPYSKNTVELILAKAPVEVGNYNFASIFNLDDSTCLPSNTSEVWWCRGYGAVSCRINPCVKKFNGSVNIGRLDETLVETSPDDQWSTDPNTPMAMVSTIDLKCITSQQRSELAASGYHFSSDQKWLGYNISKGQTESGYDTLSESLFAQGCLYSYTHFATSSLWNNYLTDFFTGTLYSYVGPEADPRTLTGPQYLQQVFNWGNISFERVSSIFTNISDSMTTHTRQSGSVNYSDPAAGIVTRNQTCLRVRWPWISFPVTSIVIVWALLLAMMFTQHKANEVPIWKSSTLPTLFNISVSKKTQVEHASNDDDDDNDDLTDSNNMKNLAVLSCNVKAQLTETEGGGVELVDRNHFKC